MDATLRRLLDALERMDAPARADPAALYETLGDELPRLLGLTRAELHEKLADIEYDVEALGEEAAAAAERAAQAAQRRDYAERVARVLKDVTRSAAAARAARQDAIVDDDVVEDPTAPATAKERILRLMASDPGRRWTPQLLYHELRRRGNQDITRASVNSTLQRAAASGGLLEKVGTGTYRFVGSTAFAARSTNSAGRVLALVRRDETRPADDQWLTEELLDRVALEAATCHLAAHPGDAEPERLVAEAKRRLHVWIDRHHQQPYDEGHVRRLMKTALSDDYRTRSGTRYRKRTMPAAPKEETA